MNISQNATMSVLAEAQSLASYSRQIISIVRAAYNSKAQEITFSKGG